MHCAICKVEAPLKHVVFQYNFGLLYRRVYKKIDGYLCKDCINKIFWRFTLINLVGWLGIISAVVAPFCLVSNIAFFLQARNLPRPTDEAKARKLNNTLTSFEAISAGKTLNKETIAKLSPHIKNLNEIAGKYQSISEFARDAAKKYHIAEQELIEFIRLLKQIKKNKNKTQQYTTLL